MFYTDHRAVNRLEIALNDAFEEGYQQGEAGGYEEGKDRGFDEGFGAGKLAAYDEFLSDNDEAGMFNTPQSFEELQEALANLGAEGLMAAALVINFLRNEIKQKADEYVS